MAEGIHASAYAQKWLIKESQTPLGRVVKSSTESDADDRELWGLRDRKPDPSLLYKLDDAILLCVCSAHLFPEDSYTFCSTVLGKLNQDASVVCLTSAPAARYKSDTHLNDLDVPFGRSVATSAFSDSLKVARLERPNIVDGVAAAMLSACEMKGRAAALCVVYTSSLELEAGGADAFSGFLRSTAAFRAASPSPIGAAAPPAPPSGRRRPAADVGARTGNLYT